jgi:hypothetical protein
MELLSLFLVLSTLLVLLSDGSIVTIVDLTTAFAHFKFVSKV